jgi:hypothetical protein
MVAKMRDNARWAEEVTRPHEASKPPAPDGVAPGVRKNADPANEAAAAVEAKGARAEAAAAVLDSDVADQHRTLLVHVDHEGDLWHPVSPAADATLAQPGTAVQLWENYV